MADPSPTPDSHGALQPPTRLPPTAVGTAMLPPEEPARPRAARPSGLAGAFRRVLTGALDFSDELADRIRRGLFRRP